MGAILKLENICKYYHSNNTVSLGLNKINLEFHLGEFVAIIGESGSGKTTFLNVIIGISKSSIYIAFIFELLLISILTTLIGSTLNHLVAYFLSNIPLLNISLGITPLSFLITVVLLFIINIIIGLLPIFVLLNITSAKFTAKYDI